MSDIELNTSLLADEKTFIKFFQLKYNKLPDSFDLFDEDILNTLKLVDESYINNSISFEDAIGLISKLFSGLFLNNTDIYCINPINPDDFYNVLLENKFNINDLNDLLNSNKISFQLYLDGLNYLSKDRDDVNSFVK